MLPGHAEPRRDGASPPGRTRAAALAWSLSLGSAALLCASRASAQALNAPTATPAPGAHAAPAPTPASAPASPATATADGAPAPALLLHLTVNDDAGTVVLQRRATGRGPANAPSPDVPVTWQDVCASPCDAPVPRNIVARIAAPGAPESDPFQLDAGVSALRVRRGNAAWLLAGRVVIITGLLTETVGSVLMALGFSDEPQRDLQLPSLALVAAGIAVAVPGIVMVLLNETSVSAEAARTHARRREASPRWIPGGVAF